MSSTSATGNFFFDSGVWGQASYRRWGFDFVAGRIKRLSYTGTTSEAVDLMALKANTWYEALVVVDGVGQFRVKIWERDNPSVSAENLVTHTDWSNLTWTFRDYMYSGTQDVEEYREVWAYGGGRRTAMTDGSGSAAWVYDARGRTIQETKVINSSGTFVTQWGGFNSADRLGWMKYPADNAGGIGEQVSFAYNRQMALLNTYSNTNSYFYVQNDTYDAAGRVDVRSLGAPTLPSYPVLKTDYNYNPWTTPDQGGRLQQIKSGVYATPDSLQDLRYTYDRVGNVLTISDYKAGSPQTQTFTYDDLNRLTSAVASGGTGGTYALENYNYDGSTGNLASKAGVSYTYSASVSCTAGNRTIPHAVSAAGGNSYSYDCNGNMTQRAVGSAYNLAYDAENRLTTVSGGTTANFVYDGDGKRVKGTAGGVTTTYIGNYFEWTIQAKYAWIQQHQHDGKILLRRLDPRRHADGQLAELAVRRSFGLDQPQHRR
jgi:hypothetical protein